MKNKREPNRAFTLVELTVVIATMAILAACVLPALARARPQAERVRCSDNLRQVGIAFRSWAAEHNGTTPMQIGYYQGGNADTDVGQRAVTATQPTSRGISKIFLTMSNELSTPKILFCPAEYESSVRRAAATFNGVGTPSTIPFTNDLNVSYFVGVDALESYPRMLLTGDHSMGSGGPVGGPPPTAFQTAVAANQSPFVSLGTNFPMPNAAVGWLNNMHVQKGNVGMADGSVGCFSRPKLQDALKNSGSYGATAPGYFPSASGCSPAFYNRIQFP